MVSLNIRIAFFFGILALALLIVPSIFQERESSTTIFPNSPRASGQSFSFNSQYFFFKLEGNFSKANWTLYHHDMVTNTSWVQINTTAYENPVTLTLDIGYYTLQVDINSSEPIQLIIKAYGVSLRSISLGIFFSGISVTLIGFHFLLSYLQYYRKE